MDDLKEFYKGVVDNDTECLECRVASSMGLLFGGLFMIQHRKNFGKVNSYVQTAIGSVFVTLAFMRAGNLPPFGMAQYTKQVKKEDRR